MIRIGSLRRLVVGTLGLLLLQSGLVWAQAFGTINGTVRDPNGDVVPDATVTITDTATNAVRTTTTSDSGSYQFTLVKPSTYTVKCTASGFKTVVQENVAIRVNTPVTVDLLFASGEVSETVTVVGGEETINKTDASIGNTFNQTQIRQLPIEGRNVVDLLSLQPGVAKTSVSDYDDQRSGAVNGARSDQANVTLDGIDVNDQLGGLAFTSAIPVTLDSVEEFRVTTSNANADQGRGAGAQVALVTKSGSNEFHGSVYEFHRNAVTTANTFFNNLAGVEKPKLLRNVFGFSIGGPFIKDKFFFFYNYEGRRDAREDSVLRSVPSETLRNGFVRYFNEDGDLVTLSPADLQAFDPLGIGPNANALALFQQYPLPNDDTIGDVYNVRGYRFNAPIHVRNNTHIARLDYTINERHLLFARGNLADNSEDTPPQFPGGPARYTLLDNSKGIAFGYTATLTDNLTNVFRYGLTRQSNEQAGASSEAFVGFRTLDSLEAYTYSSSKIVPVHNFSDDVSWTKGDHTIGFGGNVRFIRFNTNSADFSYPFVRGNAFWMDTAGDELLPDDVGSDFESAVKHAMIAAYGIISYSEVTYFYDKQGTALPVGSPVKRDYAADEYEFYVQDTWRLRPNLTITAGLRYSLFSPPWETNGLQVAPNIPLSEWFELRVNNAAQGIPASAAPPISFDLAGPANGKKGFYDWDKNNFAPRISVAYSPNHDEGFWGKLFGGPGKSSIRGGFGVFYDHIGAGLANTFDQGGSVGLATNIANPVDDLTFADAPRFVSTSVIPFLPAAPPGGFPSTLPADTFAITFGLDDSIVTPINYQMDVSFSREIGAGIVVEAAYLGRFARNRLAQADLAPPVNLVDPASGMDWWTAAGILNDYLATGVRVKTAPAIPYFENIFPGLAGDGLTATQVAFAIARDYAPDWTVVQVILDYESVLGEQAFFDDQYSALAAWRSIEDASYNAGQFMVRKRFDHGIMFDFNYTIAKSIDLTSDAERTGQFGSGSATPQGFIINSFVPDQNRGVSDFDVTHSMNANWLWELPFGHGRVFLADTPGWADALVGGWQLSGIVRATSGFPISVDNGGIWPTNWNVEGWATATKPVQGKTTRLPDGPNLFSDPTAAFNSFGNTIAGQSGSRNILRGDGYFSLDFGLGKEFRMPWEGHTLQFRWEVFNATNTARFDVQTMSLDVTSFDTFGNYQSTLNTPRVMQFGLRYEF